MRMKDLTLFEFLGEQYVKNVNGDVHRLVSVSMKLIETLQFYANPDNYIHDREFEGAIDEDGGQRTRDILKERL